MQVYKPMHCSVVYPCYLYKKRSYFMKRECPYFRVCLAAVCLLLLPRYDVSKLVITVLCYLHFDIFLKITMLYSYSYPLIDIHKS